LTETAKISLDTEKVQLSLKALLSEEPVEFDPEDTSRLAPEEQVTVSKAFEDNYYVRYNGSTTYEPCEEDVIWLVLLQRFENFQPD
jgi:carbonic anhydrase